MRAAANWNYGVAGRAFVERLVREVARDEQAFRTYLEENIERQIQRATTHASGSARVEKAFALITVAGLLAKKWGVLPEAWGSLSRAVRAVQKDCLEGGLLHGNTKKTQAAAPPHAISKVMSYVERNRGKLIRVANLDEPCTPETFARAAGFLTTRGPNRKLMVPAARFQMEFPEYRAMVRELRSQGLAKTEGGTHPKLTIKAPSAICATGRVYCIDIGKAD